MDTTSRYHSLKLTNLSAKTPSDHNGVQTQSFHFDFTKARKYRSKWLRKKLNRNAIANYIKDNIKHRECIKFVPATSQQDGSCCCGRSKDWHDNRNISTTNETPPSNTEWNPDLHTKQVEATSFGTISFKGFGRDNRQDIPYCRIDHTTPPDKVWDLLSDFWKVAPPKLIISITGGANRFFLKNRLQTRVKHGLINAAKSTGAWLVTGGTNVGVMELVGRAATEHSIGASISADKQVIMLGITTWGNVDNNKALTAENNKGHFPATYSIDNLSPAGTLGKVALDSNHTHFLLVDDGTEGQFGKEIPFRAELEHYIQDSLKTGISANQSVHVPVVLLVIEGGENTLTTVATEIANNIPVVVIQGSGRAADFIDTAYQCTKSNDDDQSSFPPEFDDEMGTLAAEVFDLKYHTDQADKTKRLNAAVKHLRTILEHRQQLTFYRQDEVDSAAEIDQAILDSLLKANKSDTVTQLNLALAWNRCDVARTEILTLSNRSAWQTMDLHGYMKTALVQNRIDFVKLFLDSGVSLDIFLTVHTLRDLYLEVITDRSSGSTAQLLKGKLLHKQMKQGRFCRRKRSEDFASQLLYAVGELIISLQHDIHDNIYEDECFEVFDETLRLDKTVESYVKETVLTGPGDNNNSNPKPDFLNPEKHLFIWAILLNRSELAYLFWTQGKDHIAGALFGSALLKALEAAANESEEVDLSLDIAAHSRALEVHATGVLTECYQHDKENAHQLLVRAVDTWGGSPVLALADSAQQMNFMNHSSCQTILNNIWKGNMALYTSTWKIVCSLVLPVTLMMIKFSPISQLTWTEPISEHKGNGLDKNDACDHDDDDGVEFIKAETFPKQHKGKMGHLYRVKLHGNRQKGTIGFMRALYYYHTAPVTKFIFHTLSYVAFLALFSYFLMIELKPGPFTTVEYIVYGWASTYLIEEARQVFVLKPKSLRDKLKEYFCSDWNWFDSAVHSMFIASIIARIVVLEEHGEHFYYVRMLYAVTLALYYLRFMQNFYINKNIGPKVIMIRRMMTDLVFFLAILAIVMLAHGISTQALRYPNARPSWTLLNNIFYHGYWQMYGELFLDEVAPGSDLPDGCTNNATIYRNNPEIPQCPTNSHFVVILLACYMIVTNVILLNILIAMFSYTFQQVQDNSEKVWRFYRYSLVFEFFDRPTLPPPLIIINHAWRFFVYCIRRCCYKDDISTAFCQYLSPENDKRMTAFERAGMDNYLFKRQEMELDNIDTKVQNTGDKIERVITDLEQIKEQVTTSNDTIQNHSSVNRSIFPISNVKTIESRGAAAICPERYDEPSQSKEDLVQLQTKISGMEYKLNQHKDQMDKMIDIMGQILNHHEQSSKVLPKS